MDIFIVLATQYISSFEQNAPPDATSYPVRASIAWNTLKLSEFASFGPVGTIQQVIQLGSQAPTLNCNNTTRLGAEYNQGCGCRQRELDLARITPFTSRQHLMWLHQTLYCSWPRGKNTLSQAAEATNFGTTPLHINFRSACFEIQGLGTHWGGQFLDSDGANPWQLENTI